MASGVVDVNRRVVLQPTREVVGHRQCQGELANRFSGRGFAQPVAALYQADVYTGEVDGRSVAGTGAVRVTVF